MTCHQSSVLLFIAFSTLVPTDYVVLCSKRLPGDETAVDIGGPTYYVLVPQSSVIYGGRVVWRNPDQNLVV
jgi:hypothetical protein